MMVQRTLAAKSLSHAQGGTIFAGYLKILPLFMMVFPGMISRALYSDEVGCYRPEDCVRVCGSRNGCSNIAYPMLIMRLMPTGLKGLMLAVMLAALMSDLTSIFNSSATLFTVDIYQQFRRTKKCSDRELMIVGRVFVCVMVVVGVLWVPVIQDMQGAQLYIYIQSIAAYFSPPIGAVYLLAVLWPRANEQGAFWALMTGLVVGLVRMVLDFVFIEPACGELDQRPLIVKNLHYLYFAVLLFSLTASVMIVGSLVTKKLESFRLIRTTYWTRMVQDKRPDELDDYRTKGASQQLAGDQHALTPIESKTSSMNKMLNSVDEKEEERPKMSSRKKRACGMLLKFGCGMEPNELSEVTAEVQAQAESQRRIENFYSLNQGKLEKYILNVNLVIIICISTGMYLFFSIPPELHIFSDINLNSSSVIQSSSSSSSF